MIVEIFYLFTIQDAGNKRGPRGELVDNLDIKLVGSDGKKLACHRLVLLSAFPHLASVLEPESDLLILPGTCRRDLDTLITFLYSYEDRFCMLYSCC